MFCPNCGTQNPETAATCSKCNFNLKGAAAPKFKGTMLMMNNPAGAVPRPPTPPGMSPQPGGAPPPAGGPPPPAGGPPAAGASLGTPAPMPTKLKGTMVGVAPPMGGAIAPMPPRPPSIPPADGTSAGFPQRAPQQDVPPPPPFVANAPQPNLGTPPPFAPAGPVNPLGGTVAADGGGFGGGFGAPPAQAAPQGSGSGGFGGGGFGQQGPQDYGQPPPGQYGAPPPQQQPMMGGGFPPPQQDWNAPPQGQGMMPPQGAMSPYGGGQQGMMMQQAPQGTPAQPGVHGPRGQVRNGTMALVWSFVSCGFYQMWWFWQICEEMKAYVQRDEPSFWKIFLLTNVTCGVYAIYWQLTRCGALVQEIQLRAGLPNPQNHGFMYLIPYYNVILLQEELNKAWQSPT